MGEEIVDIFTANVLASTRRIAELITLVAIMTLAIVGGERNASPPTQKFQTTLAV